MNKLSPHRNGKAGKTTLVFFTFVIIAVISTSCVCPLFPFIENLTGLKVRAGNEVDEERVIDELIYPASKVLVQVTGDVDRIMEFAGQYGAVFSREEVAVLDSLPEEIKEQEISATIYSTLDEMPDVRDYYDSLGQKNWDMQGFNSGDQDQGPGNTALMLAVKEERQQAFLLAGTGNSTFIIFFDFNWDIIENIGD